LAASATARLPGRAVYEGVGTAALAAAPTAREVALRAGFT